MHGHDEKEIDRRQKRRDDFEGRRRIKGQADAAARRPNRAERFRDVVFRLGFDMDA